MLSYPILYYTTLHYTTLYSTLLNSTILYSTLLYSTLLYYTILYYTILYYTILYHTILYAILLYATLLYATLLYSTTLFYSILYISIYIEREHYGLLIITLDLQVATGSPRGFGTSASAPPWAAGTSASAGARFRALTGPFYKRVPRVPLSKGIGDPLWLVQGRFRVDRSFRWGVQEAPIPLGLTGGGVQKRGVYRRAMSGL